jgi:glycosyltransferase involved in cell wall biosynthesis
MRVAVCVTTYLRPLGLARLLQALDALEFVKSPAPELEVVVVDNDPAGSAATVCDEWRARLRWPLRYEHETRRGVSQARNRAVAATRDADFIAFIDDDEVPAPGWLDELLRVQAAYEADVVSGPVLERFEEGAPDWVIRGKFFTPRRDPTGFRRVDPGAGNVLIRTAALEGMEPPFDERFALTGGEDTHLFLRLANAGRVMVWADDAVAYEYIPRSRTRVRWILLRVYRGANTWSACERELQPSLRARGMRVAKGVARIAAGAALLPVSWLFGRHMIVRSLWYMSFGAGNLAGMAGLQYNEYRTTDGS